MEQAQASGRTCWRCGADASVALVCPSCGSVQAVPNDADLFAVLGLPRALVVDAEDLARRYHEASRLVHPDRHQTAGDRERELSLAASAAVNRAYRTLRDPVARGRYWLALHGRDVAERDKKVPPALVAQVFETQETLEAFRAATGPESERLRGDVVALRDALTARLDGLCDVLVAGYATGDGDTPVALDDLRRRLSEIAYLRTLLGDVEDTIGEGLRATHHRH
jgi:molecular chaperone HscB